jgi:hypothetical protein
MAMFQPCSCFSYEKVACVEPHLLEAMGKKEGFKMEAVSDVLQGRS